MPLGQSVPAFHGVACMAFAYGQEGGHAQGALGEADTIGNGGDSLDEFPCFVVATDCDESPAAVGVAVESIVAVEAVGSIAEDALGQDHIWVAQERAELGDAGCDVLWDFHCADYGREQSPDRLWTIEHESLVDPVAWGWQAHIQLTHDVSGSCRHDSSQMASSEDSSQLLLCQPKNPSFDEFF